MDDFNINIPIVQDREGRLDPFKALFSGSVDEITITLNLSFA